ncbi:MAG TPA: M56 family metallopeptidase [Longimicrobiaceae bacterium]|nr:M56 family metallopeptidase [Longimicrobiaceae bacterium]
MVVTWMLYCTAVSALFGLAALALERALHPYGCPTRWVWAGALVLSTAVPLGYNGAVDLRSRLLPPAPPPAGTAVLDVGLLAPAEPELMEMTPAGTADLLLLLVWPVASLLLLLTAGGLVTALRLQRRRWPGETVAGVPVLVSPRTGPAVVGFFRAEIVLPEWVLAWDEPRRRMVVEHEREHIRARDPLLLLLALLTVLLVPWNAALWWQFRRLRLALEVDCDARVLRGGPDPREYGKLLVDVGGFASGGRIPVPALTEPRSFLERRIRIIASPKARHRLRAAVGYATACAAALASAAAVPPMAGSFTSFSIGRADGPRQEPRYEVLELSRVTTRPRLANAGRVAGLIREKYPPLLRAAGIAGSARVDLVVDPRGVVVEPRVVSATHPAFAEAALAVVREASFIPARRGRHIVAVRLRLPVVFTLSGEAGIADPAVRVRVGLGTASELGELDIRPRLLNSDEVRLALLTAYPPLLREAGLPGSATIALVITPEGTIGEVEVVEASRPEFGAAAVQAIRGARFSSGVRGGRAVPVRGSLTVRFSLDAPPAAGRPGR